MRPCDALDQSGSSADERQALNRGSRTAMTRQRPTRTLDTCHRGGPRPSGFLLEASGRPRGRSRTAANDGHSRVMADNAATAVDARSAGSALRPGCSGLQRGCMDATRPGQKHALTWSYWWRGQEPSSPAAPPPKSVRTTKSEQPADRKSTRLNSSHRT